MISRAEGLEIRVDESLNLQRFEGCESGWECWTGWRRELARVLRVKMKRKLVVRLKKRIFWISNATNKYLFEIKHHYVAF